MFRKLIVLVMAVAISFAATAPVFAQSEDPAGAVYLLSNSPTGNQVVVYNRSASGSLSLAGSFSTGGLGSGVGLTVPPDPLGSQNSIIVAPGGELIFAVNAGSNEVSSLRVMQGGLKLAGKAASGGDYPVSLTYHDGLLYVLNAAGQGSISGLRVLGNGRLQPLAGSTRSLNAATPANGAQPNILEAPGQVGFSPDGRYLVVTDKGGVSGQGRLLVFKVSDGLPSTAPVITPTAGPVPFSFTFDRFGHLVVVDAGTGSLTAYAISAPGSLTVLSTVFTAQAATCWIAANSRFIYTDNTGSGTLSGFSSSPAGILAPVTPNGIVRVTGAGTLPIDMGISHNGRFVYSLETGAGMIAISQANPDGTLTSLGTAGSFPAIGGYQGIAVY